MDQVIDMIKVMTSIILQSTTFMLFRKHRWIFCRPKFRPWGDDKSPPQRFPEHHPIPTTIHSSAPRYRVCTTLLSLPQANQHIQNQSNIIKRAQPLPRPHNKNTPCFNGRYKLPNEWIRAPRTILRKKGKK